MTKLLSKLNFRDIGGISGVGGRLIRKGQVFRSEGPASFDDAHADELRALGIKLVADLRSEVERTKDPHRWLHGDVRVLELDLNGDLRVHGNEGWNALATDQSREGAEAAMRSNYETMPVALLPHLAPVVDALIAGETPMLVHCTAGKDRTGVLLAVLLRALGATQVDIMQDYLRSDVFRTNRPMSEGLSQTFLEYFGFVPSQAIIDAMMGVHPDYLEAALTAIERDWGSIETYLAAAGIDAKRLGDLREAMLLPVL